MAKATGQRIMWRKMFSAIRFAIFVCTFGFSVNAFCQSTDAESDKDVALRIDGLKSKLAALEASPETDGDSRDESVRLLNQAIADVGAADGFSAKAEEYRQLAESAPKETQKISEEIEKLELAKESIPKLDENASLESINAKLADEENRLRDLTEVLKNLDDKLSKNDSEWAKSGQRLVELKELINMAENETPAAPGTADSPLKEVQGLAAKAAVSAQRSEQEMIEQERLISEARLNLNRVKRTKAALELAAVQRSVDQLQAHTIQKSKDKVGELRAKLTHEKFAAFTNDKAIADLLEGIESLSESTTETFEKIRDTESELADARSELAWIKRESESLKAQIEVAGLEETSARMALELDMELRAQAKVSQASAERKTMMSEARLSAFQTNRDLRNQLPVQQERDRILGSVPTDAQADPSFEEFKKVLTNAIEMHRQLQADNAKTNRRLVDGFNDLNVVEKDALAHSEKVRLFLGDKLLWEPNFKPLGTAVFQNIPGTLTAAFTGETPRKLVTALSDNSVLAILTLGLFGLLLFGLRKKWKRFLAHSATLARKPSKDRILNTIRASLAVFVLATPFPLLLVSMGWIFTRTDVGNTEVISIGIGLIAVGIRLLLFLVTLGFSVPNGVCEVHFGWSKPLLKKVRKTIRRVAFIYLPASFLLSVSVHDPELNICGTLGRIAMIVAMATISIYLWRMLFGRGTGILKGTIELDNWWMRIRWIWIPILIGFPVLIIFLAVTGRLLAAITLFLQMESVVIFVNCGLFAYGFLTRWVFLKERRLQIKTAREALLKTAENEKPSSGDEGRIVEIEESSKLDFGIIQLQTRKLVNAICSMGVILAIWFTWYEVFPIVKILDTRYLFGDFSIADALTLVLWVIVSLVLLRNLKGLLELTFFGAVKMDAGARHAIITLSQYAVIGTAAMLIFNKIGMDWSQFGWIAAALSVGLGFGLQEVVANFVSGLILLFERPIRIGDIVTVAGVDGTVSRIRIRATTITNWDRKEFVVPNKEFITGTLLNWTLSTPITRVVIPVGIAYGSDTEKARATLIKVAQAHAKVLAEPAPYAVFEVFGDSTLDFTLRCFLAAPEHRIETIHELNMEINRQFAEAGIEIAFPQRDLNIRSIEFPNVEKPESDSTETPA